jgi:hypothetical protein
VLHFKVELKNLLLEGMEKLNMGGRVFKDFPQAWWCQVINVEVRLDGVPSRTQLQAQAHANVFGQER